MASKKNMKDAFEDLEMEPIDSGWDNLRDKMMKEGIESKKEEKDRKPFFYILASAFLLGVGFLTFSESDFNKKENQPLAESMMQNDKERIKEEMDKNRDRSDRKKDAADSLSEIYIQQLLDEDEEKSLKNNIVAESGNSGKSIPANINKEVQEQIATAKSDKKGSASTTLTQTANKKEEIKASLSAKVENTSSEDQNGISQAEEAGESSALASNTSSSETTLAEPAEEPVAETVDSKEESTELSSESIEETPSTEEALTESIIDPATEAEDSKEEPTELTPETSEEISTQIDETTEAVTESTEETIDPKGDSIESPSEVTTETAEAKTESTTEEAKAKTEATDEEVEINSIAEEVADVATGSNDGESATDAAEPKKTEPGIAELRVTPTDSLAGKQGKELKKKYANHTGKMGRESKHNEQRARSWVISVFAIGDLLSTDDIVNVSFDDYAESPVSTKTSNVAVNGGINIGVVLTERIMIETGFWYTQRRSVLETMNLFDSVGNSAGTIEYNYHGKYIDIPVRVKVYKDGAKMYRPNEKSRLFMSVGVLFSKSITNKLNYYSENIAGSEAFTEEVGKNGRISYMIGGGGEYNINSRISLFGEVMGKWGLNPLGKTDIVPVKNFRLRNVGFAVGASYSF
ncbi:MAG: hypothetical protein HRT71_02610 [Flavobacteriales bacterium]|nr:hypothetical protein [Flavobacteriales bacterium]